MNEVEIKELLHYRADINEQVKQLGERELSLRERLEAFGYVIVSVRGAVKFVHNGDKIAYEAALKRWRQGYAKEPPRPLQLLSSDDLKLFRTIAAEYEQLVPRLRFYQDQKIDIELRLWREGLAELVECTFDVSAAERAAFSERLSMRRTSNVSTEQGPQADR